MLPLRVTAIDALRGMVMLLMLNETLQLWQVAKQFPESSFWQAVGFHTSHVEWRGCSLHDLIQPTFSFLVGVALPFSLIARRKAVASDSQLWQHAAKRAFLLILLGVVLRYFGYRKWNTTFEDTLSQIGLGYLPLFWFSLQPRKWQWAGLIAVLAGFWALFAFWPIHQGDQDWPRHFSGFLAHWNKNVNPTTYFDHWFLNLFPRQDPFRFNGGGYGTLSFIPTLGTMLIGLLTGQVLASGRTAEQKIRWMLTAGIGFALTGVGLDWLVICPIVKRIWTPAWALASGGIAILLLCMFYALTDLGGRRTWVFPLLVVGANSIFIYVFSHLVDGPMHKVLGMVIPDSPWQPVVSGLLILTTWWWILWTMYRRRWFLKI
jgi:heparan-alpha-glucosaminide N-acetyltransferase